MQYLLNEDEYQEYQQFLKNKKEKKKKSDLMLDIDKFIILSTIELGRMGPHKKMLFEIEETDLPELFKSLAYKKLSTNPRHRNG